MKGVNASLTMIETLMAAGVTVFFVNLGSDHPGIIKALAEIQSRRSPRDLQIFTSPHEMVALSAAQGYAQVSGKPAAVFVHVDVGTQCMGGAVHNVDRNCAPVFIFAGQSPATQHEEYLGSRNEFIHYLQDVPDQLALVRQYMRYTALIHSPLNAPEVILRAMTFAKSEPKGPVYISAVRETMEEHHEEVVMRRHLPVNLNKWTILQPRAVDEKSIQFIVNNLLLADNPLIITTSLGRSYKAVDELVRLADFFALSVICSAPSSVCFPATHSGHVGYQFGPSPDKDLIPTADFILILDADVPWIPKFDKPDDVKCKVVHIDKDPLKIRQNYFHVPVDHLIQADTELALKQINDALPDEIGCTVIDKIEARRTKHDQRHAEMSKQLDIAAQPTASGHLTVPNIVRTVRDQFPKGTMYLNEAITNYLPVWDHLRADRPGSVFTSGGSSLGWGLGASFGAQVALDESREEKDVKEKPIVLFTGDGSFLFGIPSASYWMARRYKKPFVAVVLNNGGWNAPKQSLLGVYNAKEQVDASLESLNLSFDGDQGEATPDYGGLAEACGGAVHFNLPKDGELIKAVKEAKRLVMQERKSVLLDCIVSRP